MPRHIIAPFSCRERHAATAACPAPRRRRWAAHGHGRGPRNRPARGGACGLAEQPVLETAAGERDRLHARSVARDPAAGADRHRHRPWNRAATSPAGVHFASSAPIARTAGRRSTANGSPRSILNGYEQHSPGAAIASSSTAACPSYVISSRSPQRAATASNQRPARRLRRGGARFDQPQHRLALLPVDSSESLEIKARVVQGGRCQAPRLADGGLSAGQGERAEMAEPLEPGKVGEEELATQSSPAGPHPVPSKATPRDGPLRPCSARQEAGGHGDAARAPCATRSRAPSEWRGSRGAGRRPPPPDAHRGAA